MPDFTFDVSAVKPVLVALSVAVAVVAARSVAGGLSLRRAVWAVWAGLAGSSLAGAALSQELLTAGTGGLAVSGLAALGTATLVTEGATAAQPPGAAAAPAAPVAPAARPGRRKAAAAPPPPEPAPARVRPQLSSRTEAATLGGLLVGGLVLAALGAGGVAVLGLLAVAAAVLAGSGWRLGFAVLFCFGVSSAAWVVLGRLLLSPLGLVGSSWATVAVVWLVLSPLLAVAGRRGKALLDGVRTVGPGDAATLLVATVGFLAWWSVFRDLSSTAALAQVVRLGEDNVVHALLLEEVLDSGSTAAQGQGPGVVVTTFANYFPGGSLWQASVASLLPGASAPVAYVVTTGVGIGALAGAVTAVSSFAVPARGWAAAAAAAVVGLVGVRVLLPFFELGFPGQLLAALLLVLAVGALVFPPSPATGGPWLPACLVLFVLATWWSWSLALAVLLPSVLVLLAQPLRGRVHVSRRTLLVGAPVLAGVVGVIAVLVAGTVVRQLLVLNTDGPVFRALPFWGVYALLLAFPAFLHVSGRRVGLPATLLVLGSGVATLALVAWQSATVGGPVYYGYKLQYLLFAVGLGAAGLLAAQLVARLELRLPRPAHWSLAVPAVLAVLALVSWPSTAYRGWLTERAVVGPTTVTCAMAAVERAGRVPAVAVGFGSPTADYLATKALIAAAGSDETYDLLRPIIEGKPPQQWPLSDLQRPVLLVSGPDASGVGAVAAALRGAGREVADVQACPSAAS